VDSVVRPSDRAGGIPSYSAPHPQSSNVGMSPFLSAEYTRGWMACVEAGSLANASGPTLAAVGCGRQPHVMPEEGSEIRHIRVAGRMRDLRDRETPIEE